MDALTQKKIRRNICIKWVLLYCYNAFEFQKRNHNLKTEQKKTKGFHLRCSRMVYEMRIYHRKIHSALNDLIIMIENSIFIQTYFISLLN